MTFHIFKIYADGSESRAQTFETHGDALDYLDMMEARSKASGEFHDSATDILIIKRDGVLLTYEIKGDQ